MRVKVLFFSVLRDVVGADELDRDLPAKGARLGELVGSLAEDYPGLADWRGRLLLAVNEEYVDVGTELRDGDEIALMPPVQGG